MSATATDTVTLAIDGREVVVPKGTPLVLAAAQSGIEIPVFCYEPRLGAPVGACRMCLVEVEGMPKLQAACTMTATDGMVVHTRSEKAADGQEAVLEFLLVNHPLDCPVCDKGGECPLQDLTFRYGPPNTRYALPKRTYEKPVPVSPSIALDRERCILCYRCTRFSQEVAEDEQLITIERGASSVIATFEEQPYVGAFSGNVVELCQVGALTSTEYRFKARPWEINNIPTVCGLCPTGCNSWATVREGRIERMLSRNLPELDEGWLCDKGRFASAHLGAEDRYRTPQTRGLRGLAPVAWDAAVTALAREIRHNVNLYGPESVAVVASGEQTNEEAHAWSRVLEAAGGGTRVGAGDAATSAWELLDPYAATVLDLDTADVIVIAGDRDVADAAGVLDLRVRKAVRRGAKLVLAGAGGTLLDRSASERVSAPAGAVATVFGELTAHLSAAERPVLLVTDPVPLAQIADLAQRAGLGGKPGGVLPLPSAPNERGVRQAGFADDPAEVLERAEAGVVRQLIFLGEADPVARWPQGERWRAAIERCDSVVVWTMFPNEVTGWATTILPATAALEKEGTFTNLEGRTQRLRPSVTPPDGVPAELAVLGAVAHVLASDLPVAPHLLHADLIVAQPGFASPGWEALGRRQALARRVPGAAAPPVEVKDGKKKKKDKGGAEAEPASAPVAAGELRASAYRPLFSGAAVERTARLAHQRPGAVVMAHDDIVRLGLEPGAAVVVAHAGGRTRGTLRVGRTLSAGAVRFAWTGAPVTGPCTVERDA